MQWQSGFAGLAEINMIPNKETRWNWLVLSSREGAWGGDLNLDLGFKEVMQKGHACQYAKV